MKSWQLSYGISRTVRWFTPFAMVMGIAACGGSDSPPGAVGAVDASRATSSAVATPPAQPAAANAPPTTPVIERTARPSPAESSIGGSPANVFVASVLPRGKPERNGDGRGTSLSDSPARWLDADLPQGKVGQPVVVVVPGALPSEAASRGREQGQAQRLSR